MGLSSPFKVGDMLVAIQTTNGYDLGQYFITVCCRNIKTPPINNGYIYMYMNMYVPTTPCDGIGMCAPSAGGRGGRGNPQGVEVHVHLILQRSFGKSIYNVHCMLVRNIFCHWHVHVHVHVYWVYGGEGKRLHPYGCDRFKRYIYMYM